MLFVYWISAVLYIYKKYIYMSIVYTVYVLNVQYIEFMKNYHDEKIAWWKKNT